MILQIQKELHPFNESLYYLGTLNSFNLLLDWLSIRHMLYIHLPMRVIVESIFLSSQS
jgi:hypothetical protein